MRMIPPILLALTMLSVPLSVAVAAPASMAPAPAAMGGQKPGEWKDYKGSDQGASKGNKQEIPSGTLVVISYIIIWAVVLLYVLLLALRQKRLTSELQQLRRRLDELETPDADGESKQT